MNTPHHFNKNFISPASAQKHDSSFCNLSTILYFLCNGLYQQSHWVELKHYGIHRSDLKWIYYVNFSIVNICMLKGLAMIYVGQENQLIIFRSKEIYIIMISKHYDKIPVDMLKFWRKQGTLTMLLVPEIFKYYYVWYTGKKRNI